MGPVLPGIASGTRRIEATSVLGPKWPQLQPDGPLRSSQRSFCSGSQHTNDKQDNTGGTGAAVRTRAAPHRRRWPVSARRLVSVRNHAQYFRSPFAARQIGHRKKTTPKSGQFFTYPAPARRAGMIATTSCCSSGYTCRRSRARPRPS